jgi:hypothetical protein
MDHLAKGSKVKEPIEHVRHCHRIIMSRKWDNQQEFFFLLAFNSSTASISKLRNSLEVEQGEHF